MQPRIGSKAQFADMVPREMKKPDLSQFEADSIQQLLNLQKLHRSYRVLNMMKNVLNQERHEKELANQRAQLTSNAALWDQLAEAEKRE